MRHTSLYRHKNSGHLPAVLLPKITRDDALLMFGRKSALPSATHLCRDVPKACPALSRNRLCRDVSRKSAVRHTLMQGRIPKASRLPHTYAGTYPESQPSATHLCRDVSQSQPCAQQDLERTISMRAWRMAEIMTSTANSISSREGTEGATRMLLSISSSL